MTWARGPHPARFDVPGADIAFVPLTAALLVQDYAAVMRDPSMLRRWSQQDWPNAAFTVEENLVDLERHDREQREGVALTYSLLVGGIVQGCVYVLPLEAALQTRGVEPPAGIGPADAVVRGWAHEIDAATLISCTLQFLTTLPLPTTRLWWQTNLSCPEQLAACDAGGLTDSMEFAVHDATWVLRAAPVVTGGATVPA